MGIQTTVNKRDGDVWVAMHGEKLKNDNETYNEYLNFEIYDVNDFTCTHSS
jgi:hypothetical protein